MPSIREVLGVTFVLGLSVGTGVMAIVIAIVGPFQLPHLSVGAGMVASLLVALVLLRRDPNLDTRPLWRFSVLVFVLFVAGIALTSRGINGPDGGSPVLIAFIWVIATVIAYLLTIAGGSTWVKERVLG